MEVTTIFKTGEFHQNEAFDANEDFTPTRLENVAVLRTSDGKINVTDDDGTRM